ncbi:MAG: GNAT family N-acetyltransferase [Bacilli bacterium]|nr:GNAT family N-acetyltransferase [Bacilli bacterium]
MEYDKIVKSSMIEEYSRQIVGWKYEDEYDVYNYPSYEECIEKDYSITRRDRWDNYIVYSIDGEVIFYVYMIIMNNNKVYVGFSLKPDYCSKGLGNYFLKDCVIEIKNRYPDLVLFVEVRSWNNRAIKAVKKIGFKIKDTVLLMDRFGDELEYIEMEID